jgi:hypothetical protein
MQLARELGRRGEACMETTDALRIILTELLIENATMRKLLKGQVLDLDTVLRNAKQDPRMRREAGELAADLGTALNKEVDLERMLEQIGEALLNQEKAG